MSPKEAGRGRAGYTSRDPELISRGKFLDLVEGQLPLFKWDAYEQALAEIAQTPGGYKYENNEVGTEQGASNLRSIFSTSADQPIYFGPGSNFLIREAIMVDLPNMMEGKRFTFLCTSPHFTEVKRYANSLTAKKAGAMYDNIEVGLKPVRQKQSPYTDAIEKTAETVKQRRRENPRRKLAVYASRTNAFTGETSDHDAWTYLADSCEEYEVPFLADEVQDGLTPEESLAKKTRTNPNLAVVNSFSKTHGIPDERIGYIVPGSRWNEVIEEEGVEFIMSNVIKRLINKLTAPEIYYDRIEQVTPLLIDLKAHLERELDRLGVPHYPSSPVSTTIATYGEDTGYASRAAAQNVAGVSGKKYGTHSHLTERDFRTSMNSTKEDNLTLAERLHRAKRRAREAYHEDFRKRRRRRKR